VCVCVRESAYVSVRIEVCVHGCVCVCARACVRSHVCTHAIKCVCVVQTYKAGQRNLLILPALHPIAPFVFLIMLVTPLPRRPASFTAGLPLLENCNPVEQIWETPLCLLVHSALSKMHFACAFCKQTDCILYFVKRSLTIVVCIEGVNGLPEPQLCDLHGTHTEHVQHTDSEMNAGDTDYNQTRTQTNKQTRVVL